MIPYSELISSKFENGFILVAAHNVTEAKNLPKSQKSDKEQVICGKMCIGIKNIYIKGKSMIAAYFFDLRVDKQYQNLGIAKALY